VRGVRAAVKDFAQDRGERFVPWNDVRAHV
jgi:hypothetical protein